jgi:ABC-type dipeptide/oligopeptide/nickel transport system ATPase subunit
MVRTFEDHPAVRGRVPILVGLYGPSGSGKTFSALRLATGMQRVVGGEIFCADTESRRALHYADLFKFRHLEFTAPFSPLDYLAAMEHCVQRGALTMIVDSMSHEHEGPGGVLEMHEQEVARLSGGDPRKAERVNMLAWAKPKAARRRLINTVLQLGCNAIFCFRAKEKIKLESGKPPKDLGWMPIAGDEFAYEMTVNCALHPASGGVPTWDSEMPGERAMMKLPRQFEALFSELRPLCEEIGEAMARWAAGDAAPKQAAPPGLPEDRLTPLLNMIRATSTEVGVRALADAHRDQPWSDEQRAAIKRAIVAQIDLLRAPKPGDCDHPEGFALTEGSEDRVCIHCGAVEAPKETSE